MSETAAGSDAGASIGAEQHDAADTLTSVGAQYERYVELAGLASFVGALDEIEVPAEPAPLGLAMWA